MGHPSKTSPPGVVGRAATDALRLRVVTHRRAEPCARVSIGRHALGATGRVMTRPASPIALRVSRAAATVACLAAVCALHVLRADLASGWRRAGAACRM